MELDGGRVILRSLKKRHADVYSAVQSEFRLKHDRLDDLPAALPRPVPQRQARPFLRRLSLPDAVSGVGLHRLPKGLRHGFGINVTVSGVPLNMLSKWMGHANIATTAIHGDAMGPEEPNKRGLHRGRHAPLPKERSD